MEEKKIFEQKFVHFMWDDSLEGKEGFYGDSIGYLIRCIETNFTEFKCCIKRNCRNDTYQFSNAQSGNSYQFFYYDPLYDVKWAWKQGKQIQYMNKGSSDWWADCVSEPKWSDTCEYRVKPEQEMWTACIDDEGVVSTMKACEWSRNKGRQLIEGTEEECKDYAVENYCKKCTHEVSICCSPRLGCQAFKEYVAVKKRRMTNRELAKWVAQGNGECMCDEISMSCWRYFYIEADMPVKDGVQIRGWDETEWHEPEVEE